MKVILVVAAHPDDEALGCGGTMARLAAEGAEVHVLFLTNGVDARGEGAPGAVEERRRMGDRAAEALGVLPPTYLDFPDNRMDGTDLLDIVVAVERHAAPIRPDTVFTHFAGDLNVDHRICAQAVLTAFRPMPGGPVRTIYGFEVASSTEWAFGAAGLDFAPNAFFDISDHLPNKLAALEIYSEEMRAFPHARSVAALEALARWRGATVGCAAAEAFYLMRSIR
jgi:N-acetylglucosamine malate deacetylase 1